MNKKGITFTWEHLIVLIAFAIMAGLVILFYFYILPKVLNIQ